MADPVGFVRTPEALHAMPLLADLRNVLADLDIQLPNLELGVPSFTSKYHPHQGGTGIELGEVTAFNARKLVTALEKARSQQ